MFDRRPGPEETTGGAFGLGKGGGYSELFLAIGAEVGHNKSQREAGSDQPEKKIPANREVRNQPGSRWGDSRRWEKGAHPEAIEKPAIPDEHRLYG
jgi:hypothetical protein